MNVLDDDALQRVRKLLDAKGLDKTAQLLGVSRESCLRLAGKYTVRNATLFVAKYKLALLENSSESAP